MAYVPGYEHDVFISYPRPDDEPEGECECGWVTELVAGLKKRLTKRLGRDVSIWMDRDLQGNHSIDAIQERVENSATMIAVLSANFMDSKYCQLELACFFDTVLDRDPRRRNSRVFPVLITDIPPEDRPFPVQTLKGYPFWLIDDEGTECTIDPHWGGKFAHTYRKRLERLSQDLAKELKALREGSCLTLAEVSDDVESDRAKAEGFLRQHCLTVLPAERRYPCDDEDTFGAAVDKDLAQCRVFVQLLGAHPGRRPRDSSRTCARIQYERALEANKEILQWAPPDLDMNLVVDADHRKLLEGAYVRRQSLPQFLESVVTVCEATSPGRQVRLGPESDEELITDLQKEFRAANIDTISLSEDPELETLDYLDGLLFLYCEKPADAEVRLLKYHQYTMLKPKSPLLGLYQCPRDDHRMLQLDFKGVRNIQDEAGLRAFIQEVLHRRKPR